MRKVFLLAFLVCALPLLAQAQFNSGSTGADGALDCSNDCQVQLPESGILNYTTVNIPNGRFLRFTRNSRNTSVTMLAQGNVIIGGSIQVSGSVTSPAFPLPYAFQQPGPGGFYGGAPNTPGFGAGGGQVSSTNVSPGRWVGSLSLFPIVGGSGGGGIGGAYGGGGGGAIVIASSTSIVISLPNASIDASGSQSSSGNVGPGSGGAIRLIANSLDIRGYLGAIGGSNGAGVIRLEAQPNQINFTGTSNPAAILSTINPNVVSNAQPQLTILSVGGYAIPSYAGSRIDTVDLK